MKTLVIVIHSDLENSVINQCWIKELKKHPEKYTVHHLHNLYPDEKIDVEQEQRWIDAHDKIIFQFPFYWFNCPPFFKKWLDLVLSHGWAYGKGSPYKLAGKKIALSITAGINEEDYQASGRYKYTLKQLTAPFEITFNYVKAAYKPLFAFYGSEHNSTTERIEKSAQDYISFIEAL